MPKKEELSILTGNALLYFCYDVGTSIDLDAAEKALGATAERLSLAVERLSPTYIQYRKKPLLVRLGQLRITDAYTLEAIAKVYDFGVITIRLRMPLRGTFEDVRVCGEFQNNTLLRAAAMKAFEGLRTKVADFIDRPYDENNTFEDYSIVHIEKFSKPVTGAELFARHSSVIARLLRCEPRALSAMELNDSIKNPISYYTDDLAVIDAGAAFIYSPRHEYDVHDVIEYAIIELLELRHYDGVLDGVLEQSHKDVHGKSFGITPFSRLHRELAHVRIEVTDVVEKVENSLKLIGDMYLAKVYSIAAERFGLPQWKESVRNKLQTLQNIYSMLTERINGQRLMILEIIIAVTSVLFLFMDLFKKP